MNIRLNRFICPNCHHDFYDGEHVQVVCDACGEKFSIIESLTVNIPETVAQQQAIFHQRLAERLGDPV